MEDQKMIRPDSRGRVALGPLIDKQRTYNATIGNHGVVTLVPIAATLSDEQLADLKVDPAGFAEMLELAEKAAHSEASTTPIQDFFDTLDED